MRKCPYCKADIEETAKYCYFCMHDLEPKNVIDNESSLKSKKTVILLCSILGAILLALVLVLVIRFLAPKLISANNSNASNNSLHTITENGSSNISDKSEDITHNQNFANDDNNTSNSNSSNNETVSSSQTGDITNNSATNQKDENQKPITNNENDNNTNENSEQNNPTVAPPEVTVTCSHSWQEITETKPIETKVTYYKCPICYAKFKSVNLYYTHFDSSCGQSFNAYILRERYETANEWKSQNETIIIGYKCTKCGETKQSDN